MSDIQTMIISGADYAEFARSIRAAFWALPPDIGDNLYKIYLNSVAKYGSAGALKRLNNRTVAEIFTAFRPEDMAKPVASGESDGLKWALYPPPSTPAGNEGPAPTTAPAAPAGAGAEPPAGPKRRGWDPSGLVVNGDTVKEFLESLRFIFRLLPREMAERLNGVWLDYFEKYGRDGMKRMVGRTVAQILAEHQAERGPKEEKGGS